MRWLIAAQKTRKGCFSANYWVNGTFIETGDSLLAPSDSHIDTAFQLLKACDFRDTFLSQEPDLTDRLLKSTAMNWVRVLHWADRRKVCAWSHSKVEGSNKYRLSIHTWIWKALKAIESSLPELAAMVNNQSNPDADDNRDGEIIKRLASANVQKEVLRRFTAGNDGHGKRMLATTRSSRETRFLLHASDTVLFYGLDQDFFLKNTPFNDLWQNTLEAQLQHKEKYEASWENLIRYALAVMMGARNLKINDRSPQDLIKSAMGVLLRAAGPNCLFYGVIDATTKEIELFQSEADRDFFFHASFEIPFILLTHCRKINSILEGSAQMSDEPQHSSTLTDSKDEQSQDALERAKSNSKMQSHTAGDGQSTAHEAAHRNKHNSELIGMKKSQPFNSLFDQSSIVDLDEEWLYNYPSFLSRDELLKDAFFDSYVKEMAMTNQENDDAGGSVVVKAAKALMMTGLRGGVTSINLDKEHLLDQTGIADVPKQKRGRKRNGPDMRILDSEFLWQHLRRVRTASKAKKRLIWMQRPSNRVALTCYITSQEEERPAFALFLERHANFENYFYEDVTLALNEWDTELHLSFYQLEVEINDAGRFLTNKAFKSRPHALVPEQYVPLSLGNGQDLAIVRTSLGFRFYGDFFDRHWTCYSIEHTPEIFSRLMGSPIGSKNDLVRQQDCWRQRKVLELHLFDRMIREIVRGTERTLNAIRTELGVNRGSFLSPILNSDDYFTTSVQWQKSQEILELLDEELSDTIATISKWDARERERGHERPRWTRNDERKYRLVIRKLEGTNRRRVRDLKKQHENLQMLKEMLIRSQAQIRDDLSLRGAENIRFFTYVTVVFLPLGFAASIFSMSETPPVTRILGDMAACAVVAVFITIMMLANAKKLNSGLRKLKMGIIILFQPLTMAVKTFSSQSRRNSPLILGEMERVEKQDAKDEEASPSREMNEINTDGPPPPPRSRFQHEKPGALRFWLTYIFLEFPARKVLRAFYTARNPNFRRLSTYASFIWGVVLLPVFGVTYPLHVALLNIADFTRVCWSTYLGAFVVLSKSLLMTDL